MLNRVLRHNLRNDTSVIVGYLDALREPRDDEVAEEAYETILRHVDDLIAISESARRIEHIRGGCDGGPIDLASLVEGRAARYGATREVTLALERPGEAWAGVGPLCKAVIDNLIEHTDGEATVRIVVDPTRSDSDSVEVVVADHGPGIPRNEIPARHGNGESPLHRGSGLGLWVAKWVTESYGGEIEFDQNEHGGSAVVLRFPAASRLDRFLGTA